MVNGGNRVQETIYGFYKAQHRGFLPPCLGKSVLKRRALSTTSSLSLSVPLIRTHAGLQPIVRVGSERNSTSGFGGRAGRRGKSGGGCEFLLSPTVSKEADKCFLRQIADRDPGATHVVIGDGAGFHHRDMGDGLPQNVRLITLPPYSPELNPVEKLWNLMKDTLCNRCFESLDECDATITEFLRSFWEDARKVYSLIGDGYLPSKLNAI